MYNHSGFVQVRLLGEDSDFTSALDEYSKKKRFENGMSRAEGFLLGAKECLSSGKNNVSAFMLHQAVEQCCIALIGLHMDYRCDIHNLHRLLMLCRCFSGHEQLFSFAERDNDGLLEKLQKSYLNGRYGE